MFDKKIQDQLNNFADSQKPSKSILNNALAELEKSNAKEKPKQVKQWRYIVVPLVLIVIMVSFIGGGLWYAESNTNGEDMPANPPVVSISLKDMYIADVDVSTLSQYRQLTLDGYNAKARGYYDKTTKNLVVVSVQYKQMSASGLSEVLVVSQEANYECEELQYLHNKSQYIDYYINGEYESFNNYRDVNRNYWTFIQSNYMAGNAIIDNMFD